MYYQITSEDGENIWLCNYIAIINFVNDMNEGADEPIQDTIEAVEWLEGEGYEVERRKDLAWRLNNGEVIYIK